MAPGAAQHGQALEAAASLLALAMQESQRPVDELGGALARMTHALARSPEEHGGLARELAVCIEGLQFHDRLMQQLAHVRNCLAELSAQQTGGAASPGEESWSELRARLRRRLASDSQRALLDLLLPPPGQHGGGGDLRRLNASEGSIELF